MSSPITSNPVLTALAFLASLLYADDLDYIDGGATGCDDNRMQAAIRLVLAGRVGYREHVTGVVGGTRRIANRTYYVQSEEWPSLFYEVTVDSCECQDSLFNGAGACKHSLALATALALQAGFDALPAPQPVDSEALANALA